MSSHSSDPDSFNSLIYCHNNDIEKYLHKCEVLAKMCFPPSLTISSTSSSSKSLLLYDEFHTKICKSLHCENGILKVILNLFQ